MGPTPRRPRKVQYTARVTILVTEDTLGTVDYLRALTGENRGVLCRRALSRGLEVVHRLHVRGGDPAADSPGARVAGAAAAALDSLSSSGQLVPLTDPGEPGSSIMGGPE